MSCILEESGSSPEATRCVLQGGYARATEHATWTCRSSETTTRGTTSQANVDGRPTCLMCGIGAELPAFACFEDQRAHFKSDWHRLNLKQRLKGRSALTEDEFERMLDQDEEVLV